MSNSKLLASAYKLLSPADKKKVKHLKPKAKKKKKPQPKKRGLAYKSYASEYPALLVNGAQNKIIKDRISSKPSKGEAAVIKFFNEQHVTFVREYPITHNGKLYIFDFFVKEYNLFVEFDGIHHFKPVYGDVKFNEQKIRDKAKDNYCKAKGYKLIRINCIQHKDVGGYLLQTFDRMFPVA